MSTQQSFHFLEISRNKKTYQSSRSHNWESPEVMKNRSGLTGGDFSGDYTFHTNNEAKPWVIIDLELYSNTRLHMLVYNRKGLEKRAQNIDIYSSLDFYTWNLRYSNDSLFGGIYDFNPLYMVFEEPLRFIRVQHREVGILHLHQIECFIEEV